MPRLVRNGPPSSSRDHTGLRFPENLTAISTHSANVDKIWEEIAEAYSFFKGHIARVDANIPKSYYLQLSIIGSLFPPAIELKTKFIHDHYVPFSYLTLTALYPIIIYLIVM